MKRFIPVLAILVLFIAMALQTLVSRPVFDRLFFGYDSYVPPEESREELYQDIYMSFLTPYIDEAVSPYYGRHVTVAPYDVKILSVSRPNGYRSFIFRMKVEVQPYVGPHLSVGKDHLTILIKAGPEVIVEKHEHIESYDLPPNYQ